METLFDQAEANRQRDIGMSRAISSDERSALLAHAQAIAVELCRTGAVITSDHVAVAMLRQGVNYADLGNAAGSVFNRKMFEWTGDVCQSIRVSTHGRMIKAWRLRSKTKGTSHGT